MKLDKIYFVIKDYLDDDSIITNSFTNKYDFENNIKKGFISEDVQSMEFFVLNCNTEKIERVIMGIKNGKIDFTY